MFVKPRPNSCMGVANETAGTVALKVVLIDDPDVTNITFPRMPLNFISCINV